MSIFEFPYLDTPYANENADLEKFIELIDNPDKFHHQVLEAQNRIVPQFTQEAIGQKWINFFEKLH